MPLRAAALVAICATPLLGGCLGFVIEREKVGTVEPIHAAKKLEAGKATLREALERLGPPDLILRAGRVDRAYYTFWDSDYFKFVLKLELPIGRGIGWDGFIITMGSEVLHLARLDFDRAGLLKDVQATTFTFDRDGEYGLLDNTVVENFIEDRGRALDVVTAGEEMDDDEP